MTIGELFLLILPVFALIGVGVGLRRWHLVAVESEPSLLRMVVQVFMPCLVFDTVLGNSALREPGNLLLPPIAGFLSTAGGIGIAYLAARAIGLDKGSGLRTFALAAGIGNYSYLPLPIVGAIWGERAKGVVLVHNLGVDLAIWSVGLLVLTGATRRGGWRRLISPMLVTLILAVTMNALGFTPFVPRFVTSIAHSLGTCAVPMGVVLTGINLANYLDEPAKLVHRNVALTACAVRLGILPILMLCFARVLPCPVELKRVLVVQAAMPSAVFPIIIAAYYGGKPLTAVQVVLATTAVGLISCPLWIRAGLAWLGV